MDIIYLLNIMGCLVLNLLPVIYISRYFRIGLVNPVSIQYVFNLPVYLMALIFGPSVLLERGVFDEWFNYVLLIENLSSACSFFSLIICINIVSKSNFLKNIIISSVGSCVLQRRRMIAALIFIFVLYLISFILLTRAYGVVNWIVNPREGYQFYRQGVGHWYAFSIFFLTISYVLSIIYLKDLPNLISIGVHLSCVYLLGSKALILSYAIFYLIFLWFSNRPRLKWGFVTMAPIAVAMLLINFGSNNIDAFAEYFDAYVNSANYYEEYFSGRIKLYYGYLWWTDFYKYMPRAIFETKPYVYGFLHVNEYFFPGAAEATHTTSFAGGVQVFADFGILGVVFSSVFSPSIMLNCILMFNIYSNPARGFGLASKNIGYFAVFLILFAPSFMMFFGFFYATLLFAFLMVIITTFNKVKL